MPRTRVTGKHETLHARYVMTSSGLVTQSKTASGDAATACEMTLSTIVRLAASRSSRVMPGLRGRPAVTTTTSDPAVSA